MGDEPAALAIDLALEQDVGARNGFVYTMERHNGQIVMVKPYIDNINSTKGIDPEPGKPLDYDPNKDVQSYSRPRRSNH